MLIITKKNNHQYTLSFPFSRSFVGWLKTGLDNKLRTYNREQGWVVSYSALPFVILKGKSLFSDVKYLYFNDDDLKDLANKVKTLSTNLQPANKNKTNYDMLEILPSASVEVIKAAYHALCLKNHPDVGGNEEAFKELTKAFEDIKKDRNF